ncbi:MAG TPA: bifunctional precorrin-2 dehydrogenase/sirohydrochlorin ferrochelatase [Syntrophales bacterium]|nr:bifunctional precorrin-2 dehydrogenase/sirohydrochlorin ferrochelatase [Syntrophales bacterium]
MRYYPIGLDISGKRCLVIGGGEVGERKVERLLEFGAHVTVVGRELTPALASLRKKGVIEHIPGEYEQKYLKDAFLIIGATDDRGVNDRIFRDARKKRVLANIVDDPERCDFVLPALCRQGELVITVATGGKSPALAKKVRQDLEQRYGPEYEALLKIMGQIRSRIIDRGEGSDENRKIFEAIVASDVLDQIRKANWKKVEAIVKREAGIAIDLRSIADSDVGLQAPGRKEKTGAASLKPPLRKAQAGKATRRIKKGPGTRE